MFEETKELADIRAFSEAQQKTIIQLTKKVKQLEEERDHLKKLLESTAPIIQTANNTPVQTEKFLTSDQEAICRVQLTKLRDIALDRELTLEETKKVEIFSKIITVLENAPETIKIDTKSIESNDLMGLLEDSSQDNEQNK
jgi:hypothetical protein